MNWQQSSSNKKINLKILSYIAISAAIIAVIELCFGTLLKATGMPMRGCLLMLLDSTVYIFLFNRTKKRGVIFSCGITTTVLLFLIGGAFKIRMLFPLLIQSLVLDLLYSAKPSQQNYIIASVIAQFINIFYRFFLVGIFSGRILKKLYKLLDAYNLYPQVIISLWFVLKLSLAAILAFLVYKYVIERFKNVLPNAKINMEVNKI